MRPPAGEIRRRGRPFGAGLTVLGLLSGSLVAPPAAALAATTAPAPSAALLRTTVRPAAADAPGTEAAFVADINAVRAGRGLAALGVHADLVRKARSWAGTMAAAGRIWHSRLPVGVRSPWHKLGENVGMGGSEPTLHEAFVASPRHLDNIIDPTFAYVGVGVVERDAVVFVSEVFMQLEPARPRPAVAVAVAVPPPAVAEPRPPARPSALVRFILFVVRGLRGSLLGPSAPPPP